MAKRSNGFLSFLGAMAIFFLGIMGIGYFSSMFNKENPPIESVESIESGEEDESSPTSKDDDESATLPGTSEEDEESSATPNTSEEDNESVSSPGGSIVSPPDDVVSNCNGNHSFEYGILTYGENCAEYIQLIEYCTNKGCTVADIRVSGTNGSHSYDENGVCTVCGDGMTGTCTGEHYFNLKYAVDVELPTCTESGTITYECTNEHCHQTKTETLALWGHKYGEDGICTSCGEQQPTESGGETVNAELVVAWNEAWEPEDAFFWADGFVE